MDELMHLLHQLLSRGKIKIDVSITVAHDDELRGETARKGMFRAQCSICDFEKWFSNPQSAQKAVNAKEQHCAKSECPKHHRALAQKMTWIAEMHEGENNE